jgi:hypothetical protein
MQDAVVAFARSGEFGPLRLGMADHHVRTTLGDPWKEGVGRAQSVIWNYGALEIYFDPVRSGSRHVSGFRIRFEHPGEVLTVLGTVDRLSLHDFLSRLISGDVTARAERPVGDGEVRLRMSPSNVLAIFDARGIVWIGRFAD